MVLFFSHQKSLQCRNSLWPLDSKELQRHITLLAYYYLNTHRSWLCEDQLMMSEEKKIQFACVTVKIRHCASAKCTDVTFLSEIWPFALKLLYFSQEFWLLHPSFNLFCPNFKMSDWNFHFFCLNFNIFGQNFYLFHQKLNIFGWNFGVLVLFKGFKKVLITDSRLKKVLHMFQLSGLLQDQASFSIRETLLEDTERGARVCSTIFPF